MRGEYLDSVVFVVGNNLFLNQILIRLVETEAGYPCQSYGDFEELKAKFELSGGHDPKLILWDSQSNDIMSLWSEMEYGDNQWPETYKIVIFNVPADSDVGVTLLRYGGHGIFYQKDSPDTFFKGIKAVLNGELWIPRGLANKYIKRTRRQTGERDEALTNREKEILTWLPSGLSNEALAGSLNISPHTVRTHLSNIYHKLNVSNRFEAALWAADHLKVRYWTPGKWQN